MAFQSILSAPLSPGNWLLGWLDRLTASHWRAIFALVLLSLAGFLPGQSSIPPVDRDEARFVQSTRQMLETGNYVDIRFQEGTRYKKPIGIYWLQAAAARLTGYGADAPIAVYRLASVAGAFASVLLTYWAFLPLFGRSAAFIAAAALAASLILVAEAHLAKTDAVLLATVVLTQGFLARIYLRRGASRPPLVTALGFWVGLGLGILVKGPIVMMVAGLTIAALVLVERQARWLLGLRPAIGVLVTAAIALPWFAAILLIAGNDFLGESVGNDLLGKVAGGAEGHAAPPGTHFVLFFAIFWPAAALLPGAVRWIWRRRSEPTVRFCLAWIIPSFLFFEVIITKLPHYPLPTYPAIAALIGAAAAGGGLSAGWLLGRLPPLLAALGVMVLSVAMIVFLDRLGIRLDALAVMLAAVTIGLAVASIGLSVGAHGLAAVALLAGAAVPFYFLAFGIAAPAVSSLWLSPRLAAAVERTAPCADRQVASVGYHEASLILALGTDIKLATVPETVDFLKAPGCRIALVDERSEKAFLRRAAAAKLGVEKHATVEGLNIGRVQMMRIGLYRTRAGQSE